MLVVLRLGACVGSGARITMYSNEVSKTTIVHRPTHMQERATKDPSAPVHDATSSGSQMSTSTRACAFGGGRVKSARVWQARDGPRSETETGRAADLKLEASKQRAHKAHGGV